MATRKAEKAKTPATAAKQIKDLEKMMKLLGAKRIWIWQYAKNSWGFGWDEKRHAMECAGGQLYTGILYPVPLPKAKAKKGARK